MDDKLLQDLDEHLENLAGLKTWIGQVYYNEEFTNFMTKPVLSILSSAVTHLVDNLKMLKKKYLTTLGG